MKMRELEQRSGVSREVVRIMIREGLLPQPVRTARNAAEYDDAHVRGIAAVRELQQSSRMTLKEIKAALEGGSVNHATPAASLPHLESLLAGLFALDGAPPVELTALEARAPKARRDAEAFERLGMLEIVNRADGGALSLADARLVDIWGAIRDAGFVEEAGFPPENIAFYNQAAEMVAQQEIETFFGNSRGAIDEARAAEMLHSALPLMLEFFGLLRIKAFMRQLSSRNRGAD